MPILKRTLALGFLTILTATLTFSTGSGSQEQKSLHSDNNCVRCHSSIKSPLHLSSKYFEWHASIHQDKAVGCDKCHGGDPTAAEVKLAHTGVFNSAMPESRIHPSNLPATCGSCHGRVTDTFVQSAHYAKLKPLGFGPSCTTCHGHMASAVLFSADETATMCAHCHNAVGGLMPPRPDIPDKARDVMQAIRRATSMTVWARSLIEEAQRKNVSVDRERAELKSASDTLEEVKVNWHTFALDPVRTKADDAFDRASRVKDDLMKRLGYR